MFAQVTQGLRSLAHRVSDKFPEHAPFKKIADTIDALDEKAIRDALDDYLLPVAPQLQKKNIEYFKKDPTFEFLQLDKIDFSEEAEVLEEVFTVLNQILLLQSTMSLLPPNLLDIAQSMAAKLTSSIGSDGQVDQAAIGAILSQAMTAAGVIKTPNAQLDTETATGKLKLARKQLM